MRFSEFTNVLVEADTGVVDKASVIEILQKEGFELKVDGNKINILAEVPGTNKNAHRKQVMSSALEILQKAFPNSKPQHAMERKFGSIGGIVFPGMPFYILVKDKAAQGGGSSGKLNEENLVQLLTLFIQEYGAINVTFVDKHGKKMTIKNCNEVTDASFNIEGRKKADVILTSDTGDVLPISLKKVDADMWESADSLFGNRAKEILAKLQNEGALKIQKLQDSSGVYYRLEKEIVVEPTPEEAMNAIFGTDLLPRGGVVIQTFKEEHFAQEGPNVTVQCEYIITDKADIPESHLMVWLIRNNRERNNPLPGLRTLGVTLTRGLGRTGTKDVVLVDRKGNLVSKS